MYRSLIVIVPIEHVVRLVDEQVVIRQFLLKGTHVLQVLLLPHDLLLDLLESGQGVEGLHPHLDFYLIVVNYFIFYLDLITRDATPIKCLLALCPQSRVNVLVTEKSSEGAHIGTMIVLHSKEYPQSLSRKL